MNIIDKFNDASGAPINGTLVAEGPNGVLEAPVINGSVDGALEPDEYTVAVSAGGKIVFGPHLLELNDDGKLGSIIPRTT